MLSPIHRLLKTAVAILLLVLVVRVQAHGPFDHSARIIVQEDQIELNVILGNEAAGLLLRDFPDALLQRGPTGTFPLPASFAPRVGILRADDVELRPSSVSVHAEALESSLALVYPRPVAACLSFVPRYLEISDRLGPAALEMTDENGNSLGVALLSKSAKPAELSLPARRLAEISIPTNAATAAAASAPPQIQVIQAPTRPESRRPSALLAIAGAAGVLLLVLVFAVLFLRSRDFRS